MKNIFILSPYFLDKYVPDLESLVKPDWLINKPVLSGGKKQAGMSVIYRELAGFVYEITAAGNRPVSIAGDCCAAIGVLAGLQRAGLDPTLIWFDAHGDFNTWTTTPSGFLGGMPLSMIVGRGEQTIVNAAGLKPLAEEKVILTDARDLDKEEKKLLEESAVVHIPKPQDLIKHSLPDGPLYIHFDTDIINPDEAPAMNYPVSGGPSVSDLQDVFYCLNQTGRVAAASMSTWNPELDKDGSTRKVCLDLFQTLID